MTGLDRRCVLLSTAVALLATAPGCTTAVTGPASGEPREARAPAALALAVPAPAGSAAARRPVANRTRHQDGGPALVRWRGSAGWGTGTRYQRLYDPARVTTVRGRLLRLETVRPLREMGPGVQAVLATEQGIVRAHLGPSWFLEQQDAPLRAGGIVVVTGAASVVAGRNVLLAAEVQSGGRVLRLRDGLGLPVWSWARRPQPPQAEE